MKLISSLVVVAGFFFASTQVQARDRDCDRGYRGSSRGHDHGYSRRYDDCDRGRGQSYYSSSRDGYRDDCDRGYRSSYRDNCDRGGVSVFVPGIGYVIVRR